VRRDTATNKQFVDRNGSIFYVSRVSDLAANNPGTSLQTTSLTVPPDTNCDALVNVLLRRDGAPSGYAMIVAPVGVTIPAVSVSNGDLLVEGGSEVASSRMQVPLNSSGQITYQLSASDATTDIYINTLGFRFNR